MIRKLLVAVFALAAIAAFTTVSHPVEAKSCAVASAKARGLDASKVSARSLKQLKHKVSHWAHKNKLKVVKEGHASTVCSKKGALTVCTSSAKVCG
jgi:hypothetical protein